MSYNVFGTLDPASAQGSLYQDGNTVYQDDTTGLWLVTGYRAVRAVFADTKRYSNDTVLAPISEMSDEVLPIVNALAAARSVVTVDPPEHTRMRKALNTVFPISRNRVQHRWSVMIVVRVNQAVDELTGTAPVDLKTVSVRLAVRILCDTLGLPIDDEHLIIERVDAFARLVWSNQAKPTQHEDARKAHALFHYCQQIVQERIDADDPGPWIIGDLLRFRDAHGNPLPVEEITVQVLNLIGAGWETIANALCHLISLALTERDAWPRLAEDPRFLQALLNEALRLWPPLHGWQRRTKTTVTIAERTIPADSRVLLLVAGANRDPQQFPEPDRFDPDRPNARSHLAFGVGAHRCLGERLAEEVLTTAARTFAKRLPGLRLDPTATVQYVPSAVLLQPQQLIATTGCPFGHDGAGPAETATPAH